MSEAKVLLHAYYEALHELLVGNKEFLAEQIDRLLADEIARQGFAQFDDEKLGAYKQACLAFVDERVEMYNPIGIQYTFDERRRREAFSLELQLDWYDSAAEFASLTQAASSKAEMQMGEGRVSELADELVREAGAFPNRSIISAYESRPALGKLPDYIVARAIEQAIRQSPTG
jgi:hypothetical protein